jgi:hypothetical protein
MDQRHPIYQLADIVVDSFDAPAEETLQHVIDAVEAFRAGEAT